MRAFLALGLVALLLTAGAAWATDIGIGVYGGPSIPVLMQDTGSGTVFGARVPVKFSGFPFTFEPYAGFTKMGEGKQTVEGYGELTRAAYSGTTFGANVLLASPMGAGIKFFPFAGIGTNKFTRDGSPDLSEIGYTFGLGLGAGLTSQISLIARGEVNMVKTDETSRKFANVTVGLTYGLFGPSGYSNESAPKGTPHGRKP
jgi:hypothetical protein